jgi:cation diffusion facilitator family transporter
MSAPSGSLSAILYALIANSGIALAKAGAAAYTGSAALFAEAIHSLADCANQVLLLIGMRQAQRPETEDHPMGHGRVVYFWSMLVAVLLFGLGGMVSVLHGYEGLAHPIQPQHLAVSLAVLMVAVGLECFSLYGALRGMREERGSLSLWAWFKQTRQPELMVVAGEDIAALGGLLIAFLALTATSVTGNAVYDALGSMAVGALLVAISIVLLVEIKGLVTGESASPEQRAAIEAFVAAQPEVAHVFRVITLQFGNDLMVAVKAKMAPCASAEAMVDAINLVEDRLQQRFGNARWVFFEPDVR